MDGDDDLFAVFDADEGGDKPSKIPPSSASDERQVSSPFSLIMHACTSHQTDGASLVAEICGTKRQLPEKCEEDEEEGETKKLKKEEKLVMTGLSDVQIRERMGEVVGEPKDEDLGQVKK